MIVILYVVVGILAVWASIGVGVLLLCAFVAYADRKGF